MVSKILWKSWKSFAQSKNEGPKIDEKLIWPEFTFGQPDDVIGVEITRNPMIRSFVKNVNCNFWDSINNGERRCKDENLELNFDDVITRHDSQKSKL